MADTKYVVDGGTLSATLAFLGQQPYYQVSKIIDGLRQSTELKIETKPELVTEFDPTKPVANEG